MAPYEQHVRKYERKPEPGNPARTEAWALLEAAKRLAASITYEGEDPKETRELRKGALRLNWRLWTIFQSELTTERSDVPEEIRVNMLTLCKFIDKHTVGALAKPTPEALTVLIDINRHIAAGLAQVPEGAETAEPEPAQPAMAPEHREQAAPPPREPQNIDTEI